MERNCVGEFLDDFLRQGDECAFAERSGYRTLRRSYCQVAETAFQFARELQARKIGKGDCVLLWGPNSAAWVSAFFGCAVIGVIAVPMDDAASADFALRVFHQVKAKLLVCSRKHQQASVSTLTFEEFDQTLAA